MPFAYGKRFVCTNFPCPDRQKIWSTRSKSSYSLAARGALLVCEHFALTVATPAPAPSPAHSFHIHFVALAGTDLCVLLQISINARDVREIFKVFSWPWQPALILRGAEHTLINRVSRRAEIHWETEPDRVVRIVIDLLAIYVYIPCSTPTPWGQVTHSGSQRQPQVKQLLFLLLLLLWWRVSLTGTWPSAICKARSAAFVITLSIIK